MHWADTRKCGECFPQTRHRMSAVKYRQMQFCLAATFFLTWCLQCKTCHYVTRTTSHDEMHVCVFAESAYVDTLHSINKWCTVSSTNSSHQRDQQICSESGHRGLERHRKLQQADIQKDGTGSRVSSVSPHYKQLRKQKSSWEQTREGTQSFWLISRPEL